MLWISATLTAVLACLLMVKFLKLIWSHKNYPPGPVWIPLIGSIWRILPNFSQDTFIKLARQYGNIYTIWVGLVPAMILSGFEAVKEGLIKHSGYFDERPRTPFFEAMAKGMGIVFSNGHTWKQQRKFGLVTMRKLGLGKKGMEQKIEEEAHQLVETFAQAKGQPLDPLIPVTNAVTNVICALSFGQRFSGEDKEFLKLRDALFTFVQFTATFFHLGAIVIGDLRSVLLDPKYWETLQEFNPNHFLDKEGKFVEREEFLPFGAGARVCMGEQLSKAEVFIFFSSLLRAFTFQPPEGVKKINDEAVI